MATEKQIESMVTEDDEVAMERLQIVETEFPPELHSFRSIIAGGVKYINYNLNISKL